MLNSDWLNHFVEIAILFSTRSKDPSTRVGAVIVDDQRRILGTGYNGFPRGVNDDPERYANKMVKYQLVVHAEANAILNTRDIRVLNESGVSLICTKYPCSECTKLIIQSGIRTVYSPLPPIEGKWADDAYFAQQMMNEACIEFVETHLPRHGVDMETFYERGIRKIAEEIRPPDHHEECNKLGMRCDPRCTRKDHDPYDASQDTISRLLRGKTP